MLPQDPVIVSTAQIVCRACVLEQYEIWAPRKKNRITVMFREREATLNWLPVSRAEQSYISPLS